MTPKDPLVDLLIHDLTGPLSIVLTSVNNLINKEDKCGPYNEYQKDTLKRAQRNAEKARALLLEIIEVYRSEEGLFRKDQFLISDVLREALIDAVEVAAPAIGEELARSESDSYAGVLERNGIIIEVEGRYSTAYFTHDPKKIRQILRNLISNALKYRKSRMKLTITGDPDLVIAVEDDGQGIPRGKQDYIFKRFFNLNNKADAPEGLGFGLSCVKSLVERMRGEISLRSSEGAGSCFTVRIPPLGECSNV
ncbi:MAG: sensor histidine kinase [Syntrophorhabdaceae bacterium]|nr:sensor histidine kinase [Syntrophorhabdaceae bacterium]